MIHTENRSGLTAISETIFCTGFANFPPRIDGFSHYWQIGNLHISVCKTRIRGNPVVHTKEDGEFIISVWPVYMQFMKAASLPFICSLKILC